MPKNEVRGGHVGVRLGGPIKRDRLFYFFNYEEFTSPAKRRREPNGAQRQRGERDVPVQRRPAAGVNLGPRRGKYRPGQFVRPDRAEAAGRRQGDVLARERSQHGHPERPDVQLLEHGEPVRRYPTLGWTTTSLRAPLRHVVLPEQYRCLPRHVQRMDDSYPGSGGAGGQTSERWSVGSNWQWTVGELVTEVRGGATHGTVQSRHVSARTPTPRTRLLPDQLFRTSPLSLTIANNRDAPNWFVENT